MSDNEGNLKLFAVTYNLLLDLRYFSCKHKLMLLFTIFLTLPPPRCQQRLPVLNPQPDMSVLHPLVNQNSNFIGPIPQTFSPRSKKGWEVAFFYTLAYSRHR